MQNIRPLKITDTVNKVVNINFENSLDIVMPIVKKAEGVSGANQGDLLEVNYGST